MPDDELQRRPALPPLVRRLASPAGLIMAGLCLLLPFMSASCASESRPRVQWQVTYTGVDVLTGGRPDVAFTDDADKEPIHTLDDAEVRQLLGTPPAPLPPQPSAWLAVALLVAALAATALPSRTWRRTATGGLALAAAVVLLGATVLARHDATDAVAAVLSRLDAAPSAPAPTVAQLRAWDSYGQVRDTFHYAYGLWLAIAALLTVGVANTVGAGRAPTHDQRPRRNPDPPRQAPGGEVEAGR